MQEGKKGLISLRKRPDSLSKTLPPIAPLLIGLLLSRPLFSEIFPRLGHDRQTVRQVFWKDNMEIHDRDISEERRKTSESGSPLPVIQADRLLDTGQ